MIRSRIPLVLLVLAAVAVSGCDLNRSGADGPPEASGVMGEETFPLIRGGYEWRYPGGKYVIADTPSPDQLVNGQPVHAVEPGAEMMLSFPGKAPHTIAAELWGRSTELPVENGKLALPTEEGTYVLAIMYGLLA